MADAKCAKPDLPRNLPEVHRHITDTYQTEATRQGVAVDPCDDRHTAALQAPEQLNDVVARIGWVDDEGRAIGAGPRAVDSVPKR